MQTHPATHSTEIFPETLLVSREGERIYTTSRSVAFYFGKRHTDVLRGIRKSIADIPDESFSRRNFASANYRDEQNKPRKEYHLSKAGFMFVAMRFTGKEAAIWQQKFIEAFEQQEAELVALRERYVAVLDKVRPHLRLTVQDFEAGLSRQATALKCGKSEAAITYRRSQARRFGLLPAAQRRTTFISNPEGVAA